VNTHGNSSATPGASRPSRTRRGGVSVETLVLRESGDTTVRPGGAHRRTPGPGIAPAPLLAATAVAGAAAASVSSVVVLSTGGGALDLVRGAVQAAGHTADDANSRLFATGAADTGAGGDHDLMDGSRIAALAQLAAGVPTVLASAAQPQALPQPPVDGLSVAPAPAGPTSNPATEPADDDKRDQRSSGSGGSDSDNRGSGNEGSGGSDDRPDPTEPPTSDPDPTPSPDPDPTPSPDPDPTPSPDPDDPPTQDPGGDDPNPPDGGGGSDGGGSDGGAGSGGSDNGSGGGSDGGGSDGGGSDGGSSGGGGSDGGSGGGGSGGGGSSGGEQG
jgi:hypothetical protein